jgi:3-hexulose-6-phosphate synthase
MELQVALDRIPIDRAIAITAQVAAHVDWIEVGTSLVKQYGEAGLRQIVEAASDTPVLADLKTADDVRFEFEMAFRAGARSATVLGLAPHVTIERAVAICDEHERELMVDLMGLDAARTRELTGALPQRVVLAAHLSKDSQGAGSRPSALLGEWAKDRRVAVAGGLGSADLRALRAWPQLRVIVGSTVTQADDPLATVHDLLAASGRESS